MCPSSVETTVFVRHLVLVILHGWLAGMQVFVPTCIPDSHLYRITSTKCRINTVVSPDDGHIVARNMYRKKINILRKIVQQVSFIYIIILQSEFPTIQESWFKNTASVKTCCPHNCFLMYVYVYIGFKTFFYVVRHLHSIASYLPTGLHLGFFRL